MAAHVPNEIRINQLNKLLKYSESNNNETFSRVSKADTVHDFKSFTSTNLPVVLNNMFKDFGREADPKLNQYNNYYVSLAKSIGSSTPKKPMAGLRKNITTCSKEVDENDITFERNANIYFDNCNLENIFYIENSSTTWKSIVDIDEAKYQQQVFKDELDAMENTIFITGWNGSNYNDEKYDIIMNDTNQIKLGRYILFYLFGKIDNKVYLTFDSKVDKTKLALKGIPQAIQVISPQQISDSANSQMDVFKTKGQIRTPMYEFHINPDITFIDKSYMYTSLFWSKDIFDLYLQDDNFNDDEAFNGANGFRFILNIKTGNFGVAPSSTGIKIFTPTDPYEYDQSRNVIMNYMEVVDRTSQGPSKETLARMSNHIYINKIQRINNVTYFGGGDFLIKNHNYDMKKFVVNLSEKLFELFFPPPAPPTVDDIITINMYIIAFLIDLKRTGDYEQVNFAKNYADAHPEDHVVFTTGDVLCFTYAATVVKIPAILEAITKNNTKTLFIHREKKKNSVAILTNLIIKFLKFKKDFLYYYKYYKDENIQQVLDKLRVYQNSLKVGLNSRKKYNGDGVDPLPKTKVDITNMHNDIIIRIISLFIIYKIDDIIIYYNTLLVTINKIVYNTDSNNIVNNLYTNLLNIPPAAFANEANAAHYLTTTIKSEINDICTFSDNIMTFGEISKLVNHTKSILIDGDKRINSVVSPPPSAPPSYVYGLNVTHGEPPSTAAAAAATAADTAAAAATAAAATPLDGLDFTKIISIVKSETTPPPPVILDNFLNLFQFNLDIIKLFYNALNTFNTRNNKISVISSNLNQFAKDIRKNIDISTFFKNENYTIVFNKLFNQLNDIDSWYNDDDGIVQCSAKPNAYKLKGADDTNCMNIKYIKTNILKHIFNELICKRHDISVYDNVKIEPSCNLDGTIPDFAAPAVAAPAAAAPAAAALLPVAPFAGPVIGGARDNREPRKPIKSKTKKTKEEFIEDRRLNQQEIKRKNKEEIMKERRYIEKMRTIQERRSKHNIDEKNKYILDIGDIYINSINELYLNMMKYCNNYINGLTLQKPEAEDMEEDVEAEDMEEDVEEDVDDMEEYVDDNYINEPYPVLLEYSFLYHFYDILNKTYNRTNTIYAYEEGKFVYKWVKYEEGYLKKLIDLINAHDKLFGKGNLLLDYIKKSIIDLTVKKGLVRDTEKLVKDLLKFAWGEEFKNRKKLLYDKLNVLIESMIKHIHNDVDSKRKLYKILIDFVNKLKNDLNDYCNKNMIDFNINFLNDILEESEKKGLNILTTPIGIADHPIIHDMNELLKKLNKIANALEYCYEKGKGAIDTLSDIEQQKCQFYFSRDDIITKILFQLASYKNVIDMRYSSFYNKFKNKDFLSILDLEKKKDVETNYYNFFMLPIPYDDYNMDITGRLIKNSKDVIEKLVRPLDIPEQNAEAEAIPEQNAEAEAEDMEEDVDDNYINEPCPVLLPYSILYKEFNPHGRPNIGELNDKLYMVFHKPRKGISKIDYDFNHVKSNFLNMEHLQGLGGGKTKKKKKKIKKSRKKYKRNNIKRKKSRKKYKRNINTKKH